MRRYVRIYGAFASTDLQFAMEYRFNLLLGVIESALIVVTSVGAVLVLFGHTGSLNGWSLPEVIVLTGVYYLVQGLANMVLSPSLQALMEHVRLGTLDFTLLKPADSQFLVSVRHLQPVRIIDLVLGGGLIAVGLVMLGGSLTPLSVALFIVTLAAGMACVYALLLTLVTLAFWFVRVENLMAIFWAFTDAGRFPVDVYPGWLRLTLSTIVPIGIAVTVPAEVVSGRVSAETLGLMAVGTVFSVSFASWLWRRGLRSYTGASA